MQKKNTRRKQLNKRKIRRFFRHPKRMVFSGMLALTMILNISTPIYADSSDCPEISSDGTEITTQNPVKLTSNNDVSEWQIKDGETWVNIAGEENKTSCDITYEKAKSFKDNDDKIYIQAKSGNETSNEIELIVRETDESTVNNENSESNSDPKNSDTKSENKTRGAPPEETVLRAEGENCKITVTCGDESGIPENARLKVEEIMQAQGSTDKATEYDKYSAKTKEALDLESEVYKYARFFDISIQDSNGKEIQPAKGSKVNVKIELNDSKSNDLSIVHFGQKTEVMDSEVKKGTINFETSGFSVYAIVDAPDPVAAGGWNYISTMSDFTEMAEEGLYVENPKGYFFTNTQYTISGSRTGIKKTKPPASRPDEINGMTASKYYFELVEGTANKFKAYCLDENDNKKYVKQSGNSLSLVSESNATQFTISEWGGKGDTFRVLGANGYYWNMQGGTSGNGFAAFNNANDENAEIKFMFYKKQERDPYHLEGKSFAIAYHDDSVTSAAIMAEEMTVSGQHRLVGEKTIMKPDVLENNGTLLVSDQSVTEWKFVYVSEDKYYITTKINGQTKYLTINGNNVTLENTPDEIYSVIRATPGTGSNKGKWHFSVNNYSLHLDSSAARGFNAITGNGVMTWLNLAKKTVLENDDFTIYSAKKVNVSDSENVYTGQQVVIYTRVWNDNKKAYDFYAIDHDGTLIECYDQQDGIEWIGSRVNTALWEFTEYKNDDGSPNYYYELENTQYGTFISPQLAGMRVVDNKKIGINMNGRKYGEPCTTIMAWDDDSYSYSGLKVQNGRVVPCTLSESDMFYFAVINPIDTADQLTTVKTIDNSKHGIKMKMIDFNNEIVNARDSVQHSFFGSHSGLNLDQGLLSTNLTNGYPTTTAHTGRAGHSLSELFNNMTNVNHLFVESLYNESGYFEYDSTANFARLNQDGNFTVYDQLGGVGTSNGPTRTHGQFMPYNDIVAGRYKQDANGNLVTNQTDVLAHELPDKNPRKGETLYGIPEADADYYFGMEMSADFTQTVNGLDSWGHDIIFEFSGDDDFWLYVDDELVLDIGGVHPAMTGSVNFRTGEVVNVGTTTTLREVFRKNYVARGLSQAEIDTKLAEIFEEKTVDGKQVYVFRDYSNHTMKMFYMERGAGASNLHMRFNLAAVKPGTVELTKKLSGTENPANDLVQFPYQVYYKTASDGDQSSYRLLTEKTNGQYNAIYKDSVRSVPYKSSYSPPGSSDSYSNVFMIKPGETAVIDLPDDTVSYYVKECYVNTSTYDVVKVNEQNTEGTNTSVTGRKDFTTEPSSMEDRPKVDYVNHVKSGAARILHIKKKLYDEDGTTELHYPENSSLFSFRLYLGKEDASGNLPLASLYSYYVRDPNGNYCKWDINEQKFISLGVNTYNALTEYLDRNNWTSAARDAVIFKTSMNGAISKIPADYTVEVRDLIVGTQWKVEERDWEIPKGYTRRTGDGYKRVDAGHEAEQNTPIGGEIEINNDPDIQVRNQKGWGLTVQKKWTDKDFMENHDSTYFAIYLNGSYVDGTVRELAHPDTELYYFLEDLYDSNHVSHRFSEYDVREVTISNSNPVVVDGVVTNPGTVTPIEDGHDITLGGRSVGGVYDTYNYVVSYNKGQETVNNENIRTDKVTNSREGIKLIKTDWSGNPLPGAVFTLKDINETDVGAETYTTDSDGLITTAYLAPGVYTLREIGVPGGYTVLPEPVLIIVSNEGQISVGGIDNAFYNVDTQTTTITIKNQRSEFNVLKKDSETGDPIENTHFALYHQVTNNTGGVRKDYLPIQGFEDLVTGNDGVVPNIDMNLNPGTYYLTETRAAEGFSKLNEDICFTIGNDGTVTVNSSAHQSWLGSREQAGLKTYELTIPNHTLNTSGFKLKKQVKGNLGDINERFTFNITFSNLTPNTSYAIADGVTFTADANGEGNASVTLKSGQSIEFTDLPIGSEYQITETANRYIASYEINDEEDGDNIEKTRDENSTVQSALSTEKETLDAEEDVAVKFINTRSLMPLTETPRNIGLVVLLIILIVCTAGGLKVWKDIRARKKGKGVYERSKMPECRAKKEEEPQKK